MIRILKPISPGFTSINPTISNFIELLCASLKGHLFTRSIRSLEMRTMFSSVKTFFHKFRTDKRASVGMFFAITSTPLMLMGGAAIDYSRALGTAEQLQQALDTATLSGAILALRNREETSVGVFNAALPQAKLGAAATSSFRTEDNPHLGSYYYGEASVTIPTMVVKVMGIRSITITRKSAAVFGTGDNSCILTRG
ncbi:MAG: pilus assembly protein, partial [Hyphomicrobiales bacterium]|nr:pilus assembly protein [Hyphomicrobiales bacterium]